MYLVVECIFPPIIPVWNVMIVFASHRGATPPPPRVTFVASPESVVHYSAMALSRLLFSGKFYFVVLLTVAYIRQREATEVSTLYLLTLLPYPDLVGNLQPSWDVGPDIVPAIELAVELINNRTDILPHYRLELIHGDSGCQILSRTVVSFVSGVLSETSPVGIIGPGCSAATLRTSPLSARDEIALINVHLSGSLFLGDRNRYPYSFGPLGSTYDAFVSTAFALMKKNRWNRIAALFDESRTYFSSTYQALERDISDEIPGSEIAFSSAVYETNFPLRPIREGLIRIITVFTGPVFAQKIMCLAYYEEMLYPAFQWILFGREASEFTDIDFYYDGRRYNCSEQIMLTTILKGQLFVNYRLKQSNGSTSTISGYSYDEYRELYQERIGQYNGPHVNLTVNIFATLAFDGVWALALALNNSGLDLTQYHFGKLGMTNVIREQIYGLEFEGVSGPVKFDNSTGFIVRFANIFQVINASEVLIAYINRPGEFQKFVQTEFVSDTFESTSTTVKAPVAAVLAAITTALFGLIVAAHVVTVVNRKYHSLKASSPKLNHLIYIGCYIFIGGTLLYEIKKAIPQLTDQEASHGCHTLWAWLFPISTTLIFGTITARTWRLYRIFTHYLDPGPFITDPVLFTFIAILLLFDVVIATVWTAVDPLHFEVKQRTVASEVGFTIVLDRICTGADYFFAWFGLIFGYKALLLVGMTTLSIATRNIRSKDFTTNSLRMLAYLLTLVFPLGTLLYFILIFQAVEVHIDYVVISVLLNIVVFLCFALVFFPPLVPLLKDKRKAMHKTESTTGIILRD